MTFEEMQRDGQFRFARFRLIGVLPAIEPYIPRLVLPSEVESGLDEQKRTQATRSPPRQGVRQLLISCDQDDQDRRNFLRQVQDVDNSHRHRGFRDRIDQEGPGDDCAFGGAWLIVVNTADELEPLLRSGVDRPSEHRMPVSPHRHPLSIVVEAFCDIANVPAGAEMRQAVAQETRVRQPS
jgi:hypothetical protein